ncbi:DEAD/DEAH box helicase [Evansella sp. AB-P1]|uniref:DEAD/DEAH box helicase n=1 Tax=Evansella sp. AB-P1 TaxID=3037653 RepID=UPI00241FDA67|nr:DEAD/DEAH box helicase [Evansella sp. AB-P1]MDG5789838.1 DEAD/DEAH box helicase [Evansella sp. AB-P1]
MVKVSFDRFNLHEEIINALQTLKYEHPTDVQEKVIPLALQKKDLVVQSQTGTGKTASFAIPICEMVNWEENKPQALILTPTRELAVQVAEEITNIGRYKRIKGTAIFGKQSFERQKLQLKQKTHVVVGTPGRVLDHIQKGTLPLEKLKYFIIDEGDEMLNMGFIDQVESIIQALPEERMTMMFSATLPYDVEALSKNYMKKPVRIEISGDEITTFNIDHSQIILNEKEKIAALKNVTKVENPNSCIIFCGTQERVDLVFTNLNRSNYPCSKIHGGMMQKERFSVMNDFKQGKIRYLVATDVAARGIHIEEVSLVINYDLPMEKERYVHRTGRTGRAGKTGKAISFVTEREKDIIASIEEYIGFSISVNFVPTEVEVNSKQGAFYDKIKEKPSLKKEKGTALNTNIMKLYFNGGKKKKLRAIDFVGTITNIDGVTADDIGIITIEENTSYVDILNGKGPIVLEEMKSKTVKGKQLKVHKARTK